MLDDDEWPLVFVFDTEFAEETICGFSDDLPRLSDKLVLLL